MLYCPSALFAISLAGDKIYLGLQYVTMELLITLVFLINTCLLMNLAIQLYKGRTITLAVRSEMRTPV